jgi:hypothetical protein
LGISEDTINKIIELIPEKIRETRFNSICLCGKRRKGRVDKPFTSNGCSACRYYNRSLTILKKNIIEDKIHNFDITKAVIFINALRGNKLKSLRHNELTQAALSLDSMGNILLSCFSELNTPNENVISDTFVHTAFNNRGIINQSDSKASKYTNIEKSLLYYLAAMEYHYKASNMKEGVQCLAKILNILSVYLRKNKAEWFDIDLINSFNDIFISEAIRKTYFTRDFNNVTETVELKNIENKNKINLGFTSIMSEIEELLIAFYEFTFHCKGYREEHMKILYCSPSFTYLRNESLTYNRIISLLFKQKMNEYYFEKLMKNNCKIAITKNNKCNKYESIKQYVNYFYGGSANEIDEVSKELGVNLSDKYQLLEFLIADSILCLSNITDFISPTARTTLFTNSFCGGVYENLYKWTIRKEALREWANIKSWNDIQNFFIYCNDVQNCESCIPEKLCDEYSKNKHDESCLNIYKKENYEQFDRYIKELIGESSYNILKTTHLREMAYKYYEDAIQINTEGVTYQNFIKGFYILDDDLQNNTCQFYLALERYKINIGDFKTTSTASGNEYYQSKNYFKYPNESEMS